MCYTLQQLCTMIGHFFYRIFPCCGKLPPPSSPRKKRKKKQKNTRKKKRRKLLSVKIDPLPVKEIEQKTELSSIEEEKTNNTPENSFVEINIEASELEKEEDYVVCQFQEQKKEV